MKNKLFSLCGAAAPLLYLVTVILGGALLPGYSHVGQAVSELIETGAPHKTLLDGMFIFYNLLVAAFGFRILSWNWVSRDRDQLLGGWSLVVTAFLGVLMPLFFPMDPRGTPSTFPGVMHLVLAGLTSFGSMLTLLFTGLWLKRRRETKPAALYSFISLAVVFITGGMAAISAGQSSPVMGLLERITIGSFLQWIFVMSLITLNAAERPFSNR